MRLRLKPDQLARLNMTVSDIVNAVQAQNTVNSAGQIGSEPVPRGQDMPTPPGRKVVWLILKNSATSSCASNQRWHRQA